MGKVILVDEQDVSIGTMEKMEAHAKGILHRAFSVFIFNSKGEMLLQQRALTKYHSGGLWTNSCCSHPHPGEDTLEAATRRLKEEMGFTTPIKKTFDFVYQVPFENGLTEHEFDHVFVGYYDGKIEPDKSEVCNFVYEPMQKIRKRMADHPEFFTVWFHIAFPKMLNWYNSSR